MEPEFETFFQTQRFVEISSENIKEFVDSFHQYEEDFLQKNVPLQVPLNFQSQDDECNFFGLLSLLSVGSAFSHRSLEAQQDYLSDIILYGVFGAAISHQNLDINFMKSMTPSDIGQQFSIPCTEKVQTPEALHSLLTMEKPGGLLALAELLSKVLMQGGLELERRGYRSISSLLFDYLPGNCETPNLLQVMRALSEVFPHLDDRHIVTVHSQSSSQSDHVSELPFFNSIRRLLFDFCRRFDDTKLSGYNGVTVGDLDKIAGAPGVRSINALIQCGIVRRRQDCCLSSYEDEVAFEIAIRAGSIVACTLLADAIKERYPTMHGLHALSLSVYLDNFDRREKGETTFIPRHTGISW